MWVSERLCFQTGRAEQEYHGQTPLLVFSTGDGSAIYLVSERRHQVTRRCGLLVETRCLSHVTNIRLLISSSDESYSWRNYCPVCGGWVDGCMNGWVDG